MIYEEHQVNHLATFFASLISAKQIFNSVDADLTPMHSRVLGVRMSRSRIHFFFRQTMAVAYCQIGTCTLHYENLPMQYTEIFKVVKLKISSEKKSDIFLILAQNIDCGTTLEPPRRGGSNEYPQSMF